MAAVFNFIHNKMLNYALVAQLDLAYLENRRHTSKSWNSFYFIENISIYCFDLDQMAAILDFTRNAISKVRSGQHPHVRHALKTYGTHQNFAFAFISYKMIPIYCFTLHK